MHEDCLVVWYPATKFLMQHTFMKFVPSSVSMVRGKQTTACMTRGWLLVEGLAGRLWRRRGWEAEAEVEVEVEVQACCSFAAWAGCPEGSWKAFAVDHRAS
jgi:hypothetical protein